MKTTLVFATHNANKASEIAALIPSNYELKTLTDLGFDQEIPETADTLEGNALLKAEFLYRELGKPCFADDSGLEVDALNGAPGVYSARYAGQPKSDANNMVKLLNAMEKQSNRAAQFRTVICYLDENGPRYFEGIVRGDITHKPIGDNGFGYDPLFIAEGETRTFAQLSKSKKNQLSHRAKALQQLIDFLKK